MCSCGKKERWIVTLSNGMKFTKSSEKQANDFAAKHPGATVKKA